MDEYANDHKFEVADFEGKEEDSEGWKYWVDEEELIEDIDEVLIEYNYFLEEILMNKIPTIRYFDI